MLRYILVSYLALWGNNLKKAVEDMLRVCSDPRTHLDLKLILTQDSCLSQPLSPLDLILMRYGHYFPPILDSPPYFISFHCVRGFSEKKISHITQNTLDDVTS